jgi:hypothetical protein
MSHFPGPGCPCDKCRSYQWRELNAITDAVLAYEPKPKTKAQKKRARKKAKANA